MPPKTRQAAVREHNMKDIQIEELQKKIKKLRLQIEEQAQGASAPSGSAVPSLDEETSEEGDFELENPFHNPVPNQGWHGREERCQCDFIKVELPEYSGSMQAEDFIDWINAVERVFKYKDVPEDKKVILVATRLQGRASAWWEQL